MTAFYAYFYVLRLKKKEVIYYQILGISVIFT